MRAWFYNRIHDPDFQETDAPEYKCFACRSDTDVLLCDTKIMHTFVSDNNQT